MERSSDVLRRVRRAYERAHVLGGLRGVAIAAALCVFAFGLHASTPLAWTVAALLAATLGTLGLTLSLLLTLSAWQGLIPQHLMSLDSGTPALSARFAVSA